MKLKQFYFSGFFQKSDEPDTDPLKIQASILCYTDGSIEFECDTNTNSSINKKQTIEESQRQYEGKYEIIGKTTEDYKIQAITTPSLLSQRHEKLFFLDLLVVYNLGKIKYNLNDFKSLDPSEVQEITYGVINTNKIIHGIGSVQVANSGIELSLTSKFPNQAEITLKNHKKNPNLFHYSQWIIFLLSFSEGKCVEEIYKTITLANNSSSLKCEYWPGVKFHNQREGLSVMQLSDKFIQKCSKHITLEKFKNKRLGLALSWYIDTFDTSKREVKFLLLCTVLETLNKSYFKSSNSENKIITIKPFYSAIKTKIRNALDEFGKTIQDKQGFSKSCKEYGLNEDEVNHEEIKEQYQEFERIFKEKNYNFKGGSPLKDNLKAAFNEYRIPYTDLFPDLEFVKIRNNIIHEGWSETDHGLELIKLNNLVIRVFLAILEYKGDYIEHCIDGREDKLGRHTYGFIHKSLS